MWRCRRRWWQCVTTRNGHILITGLPSSSRAIGSNCLSHRQVTDSKFPMILLLIEWLISLLAKPFAQLLSNLNKQQLNQTNRDWYSRALRGSSPTVREGTSAASMPSLTVGLLPHSVYQYLLF